MIDSGKPVLKGFKNGAGEEKKKKSKEKKNGDRARESWWSTSSVLRQRLTRSRVSHRPWLLVSPPPESGTPPSKFGIPFDRPPLLLFLHQTPN
ncbi:hypothetical protein CASFOL_025161 [Castilleja foliolosa]|uniref:Uncharacterized protein n=1 Tax=Castilleja foliolosa TaxID=1961234 RepID=A0ABD3CUE2_9LAMI